MTLLLGWKELAAKKAAAATAAAELAAAEKAAAEKAAEAEVHEYDKWIKMKGYRDILGHDLQSWNLWVLWGSRALLILNLVTWDMFCCSIFLSSEAFIRSSGARTLQVPATETAEPAEVTQAPAPSAGTQMLPAKIGWKKMGPTMTHNIQR